MATNTTLQLASIDVLGDRLGIVLRRVSVLGRGLAGCAGSASVGVGGRRGSGEAEPQQIEEEEIVD